MRLTLLILLISAVFTSTAQERDYPDYRSKKEMFVRVQEKDIRADMASFAIGGMDESFGKGTLTSLPITKYNSDQITFAGNNVGGKNIEVTIKAGVFDPSKSKVKYYEKHVVKINDKPYFGNYGELPRTTIKEITVIIDKDTIAVPASAFADIYDPVFTYSDKSGQTKSYNNVFISPDGHRIYVYLLNRGGDGNYEATWVIRDKQYVRRVVDFGFLK